MIVTTAAPSTISAEAAVRLITSPHPPLVIDARPRGLFGLEHLRHAILPPPNNDIAQVCATVSTILVYDSGTFALDGAVTRGTEQVHHLYSQLLPEASLPASPCSIIDVNTSRKILLISGGLPAIRFVAPHLIEQQPSHILDALKTLKNSKLRVSKNQNNDKSLKDKRHQSLPTQITQYEWVRRTLQESANETEPPARVLPTLFVGSASHALDASWLKRHHVTHLLSVGDEFLHVVTPPPAAVTWRRLAVRDTPDEDLRRHFGRVISFLDGARAQRGVSVVHCVAGASRSIALVIAYLVFHGWSVVDALHHVKSLRPAANPNEGFIRQLTEWESECRRRRLTDILSNGMAMDDTEDEINCCDATPMKMGLNNTESSMMKSNSGMRLQVGSGGEGCLTALQLSHEVASPRRLVDADFGGVDEDDDGEHHVHQHELESR